MSFYKLINAFISTVDDKKIKVSEDDSTPKFLEDKVAVGSQKLTKETTNPGGDEVLTLDVDETFIDHDILLNFEVDEHRQQDDTQTTTTTLWSSQKVQDELDLKINRVAPVADNRLVKTAGLTGIDMEQTGITVDDSDNITGVNDLTVSGNLTVNGTTTSVNTDTLDVEDANITINKGGDEASADLVSAGLTVEMSDATDAVIGFDSTTTSKFRVGELGDTREVLTTTHSQAISNKTIDADINTITNLRHGDEVDNPTSGVHGVTGNVVGTTDTQSLTNKTIDIDSNTLTNVEVDNLKAGVLDTDISSTSASHDTIPSALAVKTYVDDQIETKDEADEIQYSNTISGLTATNVQTAIDEVEGRLDSVTSNINDHIASESGVHGVIGDVVGTTDTQSITNKVVDVDSNNFSNIRNINIANNAAIDASKIADGSVSNVEYQFINTVSSNVQDQIDSKLTKSNGDIDETSFVGDESQTTQFVTGLTFSNLITRSAKINMSITVDATVELYESLDIEVIQRGSDWIMSIESNGDDALIELDITSSGQVIYTSPTYGGFNSLDIKFRALTTSV